MKIISCHIENFGKLHDCTLHFGDGLNTLCEANGWGKSTFAAFLRAMFYGLPQAGSRTKLEEAERRKYKPWNGGVMGGSLVFEANGKEYKAERTFGKKEAEDTFRLIDLSTNLDSGDFSAELGKELFGLDKEAYSRSTYLPQNKISDGGMNDSIGKKLGKMAEGEEESGNYDQAYEMLDELRKKYIPDRQKDEKGYVYVEDFIADDTVMATKATFHKKITDIDMSAIYLIRVIKFASYGEAIILGNNKANAMEILLEKLGIDTKDTIAFGDSENDVEMLRLAGVAVVMPHGAAGAKENAHIIGTIKEAVEYLLL